MFNNRVLSFTQRMSMGEIIFETAEIGIWIEKDADSKLPKIILNFY